MLSVARAMADLGRFKHGTRSRRGGGVTHGRHVKIGVERQNKKLQMRWLLS